MEVDYVKLAEQVGGHLNELGKKASEIAVKGVIADAWATFIPVFVGFLIALLVFRFCYIRYRKDVEGKQYSSDYAPFAVISCVVSVVLCVASATCLHSVILVSIAPEWAAIKALAEAIKK